MRAPVSKADADDKSPRVPPTGWRWPTSLLGNVHAAESRRRRPENHRDGAGKIKNQVGIDIGDGTGLHSCSSRIERRSRSL